MEKIKVFFATHRIFKIFMWVFLILIVIYFVIVGFRVVHLFNQDKTNAQVEKIHNTKLTIDDVMGKNLPPDPGAEADKTVQGIDANNNGIRDDVELAVFKEYPNSAKTRAVLLQYALMLQTEVVGYIINKDTATATSEEDSRAFDCIGQIVPRGNGDIQKIQSYRKFIEDKQLNTSERKNIKNKFDNNSGSFELKSGCDIDLKTLIN